MKDENTFKSTYQIMNEIAEKWDELTDVQKEETTNLITGKKRNILKDFFMFVKFNLSKLI